MNTPGDKSCRESTIWESLNYLHISTAPDGQWADQAVYSFVGALLSRRRADLAAPSARNAIIEECAKVIDARVAADGRKTAEDYEAIACAKAIRALSDGKADG